jgi:hypothetical protein
LVLRKGCIERDAFETPENPRLPENAEPVAMREDAESDAFGRSPLAAAREPTKEL